MARLVACGKRILTSVVHGGHHCSTLRAPLLVSIHVAALHRAIFSERHCRSGGRDDAGGKPHDTWSCINGPAYIGTVVGGPAMT